MLMRLRPFASARPRKKPCWQLVEAGATMMTMTLSSGRKRKVREAKRTSKTTIMIRGRDRVRGARKISKLLRMKMRGRVIRRRLKQVQLLKMRRRRRERMFKRSLKMK